MSTITPPFDQHAMEQLVTKINSTLKSYADKDWNFSRILLSMKRLESLDTPYFLWPEILDLVTKQGQSDLKTLSDEVKWGERHSSELGILEIVSLRINKALLETTSDEFWQNKRPVLRLAKKDLLRAQGITSVLWYEVREVRGEDFDNR
ncbi:MAG TPA: hypothetical protein VL171_08020 [Verrucomicrobiae bacterium]|nr:hypothetical protein [Verrucomicrobiae bacterium]